MAATLAVSPLSAQMSRQQSSLSEIVGKSIKHFVSTRYVQSRVQTSKSSPATGSDQASRRSLCVGTCAILLSDLWFPLELITDPVRVNYASAAETSDKPKLITNIDEAREIGERRRQEKEASQGPIVVLPSGVK